MALEAGKLRHYIQLQRLVPITDPDTGLQEYSWSTYASTWASMEPASAREFMAAAAEQSEVRGKSVIRYRGDVVAADAILYRNKRYNILGVLEDPVSMYEYMTLPWGEGVRVDPVAPEFDSNGDPV